MGQRHRRGVARPHLRALPERRHRRGDDALREVLVVDVGDVDHHDRLVALDLLADGRRREPFGVDIEHEEDRAVVHVGRQKIVRIMPFVIIVSIFIRYMVGWNKFHQMHLM